MEQSLIIDDSTPRVRVITLNRPHRLNSLDGPTLTALREAVIGCSEPGRDIRAIVIRGTGRAFCTGSDLKWLSESGTVDSPAAHMRNQDRMAAAFESMETAPQVVIAAVHGFAVAGGLELALSSDIMLVAHEAEVGDGHMARNLLPSGGGSQRLPRKVGLPRALFYLLTGRRMSGTEAERIGLAAMAVPAAELESTTLALASEIARADPHALSNMKAMARRGMELPLKDGLWLERFTIQRYRNESPALANSVHAFASQGKDGATGRES